jgi:prevent-host-death family protein
MQTVTATELARNLRRILDRVEHSGEEIVVVRNGDAIARILPGPPHQTALEAMADLFRTLPADAAAGWVEVACGRGRDTGPEGTLLELDDPWAT